jgi:hypothetical protein
MAVVLEYLVARFRMNNADSVKPRPFSLWRRMVTNQAFPQHPPCFGAAFVLKAGLSELDGDPFPLDAVFPEKLDSFTV